MANNKVRIGMVGAGGNFVSRHIPGFNQVKEAELVGVSNRTRQSSEKIAKEFGIPNVYDSWIDLVQDDDIDAIAIGTWPYMHCPITLLALENGKHVLTEARMASNSTEAHTMLEASKENPDLVCQIVPAPFTLSIDKKINDLLLNGYVGDIVSVELTSNPGAFVNKDQPFQWRHNIKYSGNNIMMMGIWYETLMRWIGPAKSVSAMGQITVPNKKNDDGLYQSVEIPDHIDITCKMTCGAQATIKLSSVTGLNPKNEVWIYGTEGTIVINGTTLEIHGGKKGDKSISKIEVEKEYIVDGLKGLPAGWRVEEDFINSIVKGAPVIHSPFDVGVQYMEFTDAVSISAQEGKVVHLPFRN